MTTVTLDYKPLPAHVPFHMSRAFERAAIGGYGSGKSTAACGEALALGLEQPGSEILICRKTVPALRDTTERTFVALIPNELMSQCEVRRMGGHLESLLLPNGTKYLFRGLDDWRKLRSLNLAYILYDEADEIDEESYVGMMSRVRQTRPTKEARDRGYDNAISRRGVIVACNPRGKNWIYDRFVGPNANAKTEWFKSSSLDNPMLPFDYLDSMLGMPEPWVKQYVFCSFDDHGGAIYPTWDESFIVRPYLEYPADAYFIMGMDPGTHASTAAVWCYHDKPRNAVVAVADYAEAGLAASVHAAAWRPIEARQRMRPRRRIADPSLNTRDRGTNQSLQDMYRRLGFYFELGPRRIEDRMPALGQLIHDKRFLVSSECMRLFEQIRNYRWEDLTPDQKAKGKEAKPLKKDVDLVDAAQYVASQYYAPVPFQVQRDDRDEMHAQVWKSVRAKRTRPTTQNHDLGSVSV